MTAAPGFGRAVIGKGPFAESGTEWTVFGGGPHPDDCAWTIVTRNEATAVDQAGWHPGAGIARRMVLRGPWRVTLHPEAGVRPGYPVAEEKP